jgi:hypothetical protein
MQLFTALRYIPGNRYIVFLDVIAERYGHRQTGRLHCWKGANASKQVAVILHALNLRVADFSRIQVYVQNVVGVETEIGMLSAPEAAHKKPGNDQERNRPRYLSGDESGARSLAARCGAAPAFAQDVTQVSVSCCR